MHCQLKVIDTSQISFSALFCPRTLSLYSLGLSMSSALEEGIHNTTRRYWPLIARFTSFFVLLNFSSLSLDHVFSTLETALLTFFRFLLLASFTLRVTFRCPFRFRALRSAPYFTLRCFAHSLTTFCQFCLGRFAFLFLFSLSFRSQNTFHLIRADFLGSRESSLM